MRLLCNGMIDENPKYNSVQVACYIVAMANERRLGINMTKLQKLLYITYGTYLALYNQRLTNEHPQAWPYGPVFPTVRNRLLKRDLSSIGLQDVSPQIPAEDKRFEQVVNLVLNSFGDKNATTLTLWSHQSGSPWDRIASQEGFTWGEQIPDSYIQEYFNSILIRNGE